MARCGLGDRVCAGSGWVGIRPRAVEDFPTQMLSAYRFWVKLRSGGQDDLHARNPAAKSCGAAKLGLPEQLQPELNLPRTCGCTGDGARSGRCNSGRSGR